MKDISNNNDLKIIINQTLDKWCLGSPVQVVEYALYYDYRYNRNLVNAVFTNVSGKIVKTVYVSIECFDDAKDSIGVIENLPVSNVMALPEKQFGEEVDLIINLLNTSNVEISVTKVVFSDSEVWRKSGINEYVKIDEQKKISEEWDLYAQLLRECANTVSPVYFPVFNDKLWICTCGTVNEANSTLCHDCKVDKEWLKKHFSAEYLSKQNKIFADTQRANELAKRYEDAKVKHKSYAGYIDSAEKMEALGFYMDAPVLAKNYRAEAERLKNETENRLKEEIYCSKKQLKTSSPDELRAAASKLEEIAGYKDSTKLAQEYRAKAYAIENNQRKLEKQKATLKKKEEQRKLLRKKKILKITMISLISVVILAAVVGLFVFALNPFIKERDFQTRYSEAREHIERGEYTAAIEILKSLDGYNKADEMIEIISESVTGFKNAVFLTSENFPCYSISEDGVLSFDSDYSMKDGIVEIPDVLDDIRVESLANGFLRDCEWVREVSIPYNVKNISDSAFRGCKNLTKINFHDDVRTIGKEAFFGCTSLKQIEIPEYVNSVGVYAFSGCTALEEITLPSKITVISEYMFNNCTALKSITFEGSIKEIGKYAFSYCSSLESIELPDKLQTIGGYAFVYCTGLKNINVPDRVTSIGSNAFSGCTSLETAVIGDGVVKLENYTFSGCTKLASIKLGSAVTNILYSVFDGCSALSSVKYNGSADDWKNVNVGDNNGNFNEISVEYLK